MLFDNFWEPIIESGYFYSFAHVLFYLPLTRRVIALLLDENPKKPDIKYALKNLKRYHAQLGNISDFPSDWVEIPSHQIQIGVTKIHGRRSRSRFRSSGR